MKGKIISGFQRRVSGIFRKEKLWGSPQTYQISVSPNWRENSKKKNELCIFYISDKTTPAPSNVRWSCLFFHFWSFSFLNVVPVFFCMGLFQCYVVWVSPIFFFFFIFLFLFGCSSVSFLTRHQFWVFIFIYLFIYYYYYYYFSFGLLNYKVSIHTLFVLK